MKNKHTPGPWVVTKGSLGAEWSTLYVEQPDGYAIAAILDDVDEIKVNSEANANLIAAAPDLLSALEELLRAARHFGSQLGVDFDRAWESSALQAKAVIAKATLLTTPSAPSQGTAADNLTK